MNRSIRLRCYLGVNVAAAALVAAKISAHQRERVTAPNPPFTKMSNLASAEIRRRDGRIDREVAALPNHAWAGKYYSGGMGSSMAVTLAPTAGFIGYVGSCSGIEDQNYGTLDASVSGLNLHFTFPNDRHGFPAVLIPVRWAGRHYLIAPKGIIPFCCDVNSGQRSEFDQGGIYLLRAGDEKKPLIGMPDVPPAYSKYLLKSPITARIVAVRGSHLTRFEGFAERTWPVTLDIGSADGVLPSLQFCARVPDVSCSTNIKISSVDSAHSSRAIVTQMQIDSSEPAPRVGWALSTRAPSP